MNNNKENKQPCEISIAEIFHNVEYIIPIYQRNYAWGETEILQLLEDINDAAEKYYIGSLIVNAIDTNTFEVIDGQQRLTTIFLLHIFLFDTKVDRNSLRFESRKRSNNTLKKIGNNFIGGDNYSTEIIQGYQTIEKYFTKVDKASFIEKLKKIKIIRTQVPDNIDLNHYFEIMNTRGEQLELHEIVKGKLLGTLEKEGVDNKVRNLCAIIWDACSNMDRYLQMNVKKGDSEKSEKGLRELIFGDEWDKVDEILDIIDFANKQNETKDNNNDRPTLKSIIMNPKLYLEKAKFENETEEKIRFESIISFPVFLLQVNAAMNNNNEDDNLLDDKRLLKDLEPHWKNKDTVFFFLKYIIRYRFLFDKYIIKREYAKNYSEDGTWSLKKLKKYTQRKSEKANYVITYGDESSERSEKNDQIKLLQSCLRVTYTSPKNMHWIHRLLKELSINPELDQVRFLESYLSNKVREANIKEKIGIEFERVVFTYLDYLLWKEDRKKDKKEFDDFQFQFRTSIEHFFPQHPLNAEPWGEGMPLNDFGNLALLTVSANSKFSNLPPAAKLETYEDVVKQSPKLRLMQEAMKHNEGIWNAKTVIEHGKQMLCILNNALDDNYLIS